MDLRKCIADARAEVEIEMEERFRVRAMIPLPAEWERIEQPFIMTYRDDELAMQPDETRQAAAIARLIRGWDGLTSDLCGRYLGLALEGGDVPYTPANARTLMEFSREFRMKFLEKLRALSELRAKQREKQAKN